MYKSTRITKLDVAMLVYGAVCTFVLVCGVMQDLIVSVFLVPAGVGGICIALVFNRYIQRSRSLLVHSMPLRVIGASIMPLTVLAVSAYNALIDDWPMAGAFLMLFGFSLLLAWQHLQHPSDSQ